MTATLPAPTVLRLHRTALTGWLVAFTAVAALLLWAYGPGADAAVAEWNRLCARQRPCTWGGGSIMNYYRAFTLAEFLILWIPGLVAAWAGAALIGRELENGTARLAWTQGVTPTRWLAAKLTVPAVLLTAGTTVLVLLHRLAYDTNTLPMGWTWDRDNTFGTNGTTAIAWPLLALAVGAFAGLLLRRALPALAVGFLVAGTVRILVHETTPHLWPHETAAGDAKNGYRTPVNVMNLGEGTYHPASHFWPLQLVETGFALTITAAAVTTAFWLLRRRTA
ncbi:hypothetical protein [Streptomyces fulvoviolaceus]|uniref:hypothetical protein n=1 Tax=Streptomyces fulvoviolaceus TaxID=285535 RepID=UPI0021BEEC80|nr:hypothetical protein [Streptomyces fulvoviolaceus]MCT9077172.1 hypothetical protein [Streptomyces fulvoviolaceus]